MINVYAEPLESLLNPENTVSKDLFKSAVLEHMKTTVLLGTSDRELEIDFQPVSEDDIIIKRVDPENALGYKVFSDADAYFKNLQLEMTTPSLEQIMGAKRG